ncbi:M20/M25/M40 family metallo-hydrolase [Lacibacterium aquatile]|uniref:M20/M25/M40 family metallo-hydrolase n=1 Tax=Lacibacterium aquatile TaxID=1168082 RepID=A0ABW5DS95_9PROT
MATWDPTARTRDISYTLVEAPSITGTPGEAEFTEVVLGILRQNPYFQAHPEDIAVLDSHGDPLTKNIVALVRGSGKQTVAMAGHFDVVAIDNYRDLTHLAFKPDELKAALIADLSSRPLKPAEAKALADLQSGDFVPGRGMLDMKSGVAAGIAVLEHFAAQPDRKGNLMLCMSPDEERNSQGMRRLRNDLPALARRWGIEIEGCLNLDATSDQGDGADGRIVHHGSIGKLLPFALVVGQPTHAGYPFEGISAHILGSAILQAVEANVDLADRSDDFCAPPPICLEAKDLRQVYDVTTPEHVWIAFNWLIHSWTPEQALGAMKDKVVAATTQALTEFAAGAKRYAAIIGESPRAIPSTPEILTIADLRKRLSPEALKRLDQVAAQNAGSDNPLLRTRTQVQAMVAEAGLTAPAVVIGFGSLHYPPVRLDPAKAKDDAFLAAIDRARTTIETRHKTSIKDKAYFTGISDMSFIGNRPRGAEFVGANTPLADMVDIPPAELLEYPAVNIGPWGREYHQRHERLYAPYGFTVLPDFLYEIAVERLGR